MTEQTTKEIHEILKHEKDRIYLYLFNISDNEIFKIDLTSFFGKGNGPTDINDERLKKLKI